jgi:hypothetical protein
MKILIAGLGIVLILVLANIGLFFYGKSLGAQNTRLEYEKKEQEYNAKIAKLLADLEIERANIKVEVVTKYVDRIKTVKEKEYVYVKFSENFVPDRNILSNGWVHVHDSAAEQLYADPAKAADATPSGIAANRAVRRVVQNYTMCEQNRQQLLSLQRWISENLELNNNK